MNAKNQTDQDIDVIACRDRFMLAVRDARGGDFRKIHALVERVRVRFGDTAADIQLRELQAYTRSDRPA
ncbi:MAG: hypothetical protein VB141_13315 [Burkholderia gladioli]